MTAPASQPEDQAHQEVEVTQMEESYSGRHLHLDCSSGVSGDMLFSALLDASSGLGPLRERVISSVEGALEALALPNGLKAEYRLEEVTRAGLRGLHIQVEREHMRIAETGAELLTVLQESHLSPEVAGTAERAVRLLIAAEGSAHGMGDQPSGHTHLHEVGCLDTIVDVVGVAAALCALRISSVSASPIALGSGRIESSHGYLAVPAPATAILLTGMTVESGPSSGTEDRDGLELTTPTGAALLKAIGAVSMGLPRLRLLATGAGAGKRDTLHPNLLRAFVGEQLGDLPSPTDEGPHIRDLVLLEANIDDAPADHLSYLLDRLISAGARDAWITPVIMKKGRPAHQLSALCDPDIASVLSGLVFDEGVTLGIRHSDIRRHEIERRVIVTSVDGHAIRVKVGVHAGGVVRVRAEYDDIAAAAFQPEGLMKPTFGDLTARAEKQVLAELIAQERGST